VRFSDGRIAQVEAGWTHGAGLDVRNEIHGSHGWIDTNETGSMGVHAFARRDVGYDLEKAGTSVGWMTPMAQEPWVQGCYAEPRTSSSASRPEARRARHSRAAESTTRWSTPPTARWPCALGSA
jgi:hypothetical protein